MFLLASAPPGFAFSILFPLFALLFRHIFAAFPSALSIASAPSRPIGPAAVPWPVPRPSSLWVSAHAPSPDPSSITHFLFSCYLFSFPSSGLTASLAVPAFPRTFSTFSRWPCRGLFFFFLGWGVLPSPLPFASICRSTLLTRLPRRPCPAFLCSCVPSPPVKYPFRLFFPLRHI